MQKNKTDITRAELSAEDKQYIAGRSLSSPLPRIPLAIELSKQITDKAGKHPSVETLEKMISRYRNEVPPFEDSPWQLGILYARPTEIKYLIPPEALQIILEIQRNFDKNITIREVKWLARIYATIKRQPQPQFMRSGLSNDWYYLNCYIWASLYADKEKVAFVSGNEKCDTSYLDSELLEDVSSIPSRPLDRINEDLAKLYMNYMSKLLIIVSNIDNSRVDANQKVELNKQFCHTFEQLLTGHPMPDFLVQDSAVEFWIPYAQLLIAAIEIGAFYRRSQSESGVIINKLRGELPSVIKAYHQGQESFEKTISTLLESIRSREVE